MFMDCVTKCLPNYWVNLPNVKFWYNALHEISVHVMQ